MTISIEHSIYLRDTPLGVELRPDFKMREYAWGDSSPELVWDGVCTTNQYGTRYVRGKEDSPDVYVFMGCSMVFGMNLSDHQTMPHFFSEAHNFEKRVINTGVGGNGPHHSLRDLQLDLRLGRSGVQPSQVRQVYYWMIDDHAGRVLSVFPPGSPRYVLENGKAVYKGTFADTSEIGRFNIMLSRSRLYPKLRDKLLNINSTKNYPLMHAIIGEMDAVCRERYGVGLTVISWDARPETLAALGDMGIRVIPVSDAFGEDWQDKSVIFRLADGHPSVYANKLLGRYLYELEMREKQP